MAGEVFDASISRDSADDPLVPTPVAAQIIEDAPASSAALRMLRRVPLSTKSYRTPVLSVLPQAYWVNGDTGLKQTTKADWENVTIVAEEIAVIVPIPQAYLDDAQVPIWDEVRPRITEAFGRVIDDAVFNGDGKPASWTSPALIPGAKTATHVVTGTEDIGADIAALAGSLATQGINANGFVAGPGFSWSMVGLRDQTGQPIYAQDGPSGRIYGRTVSEVDNGSWDGSEASVLAGDFSKAMIGVRQDITFRVFTEGVITDAAGAVVLNLMQQDSIALRAVMRVGYAVATPATALGKEFPFGIISPYTAPAGSGA